MARRAVQVENYACALSNVYTFSPTFRAENSRTSRHLAEFWMVEPEMAFCTLQDDMTCAEAYVRFCCRWLLEHCRRPRPLPLPEPHHKCPARVPHGLGPRVSSAA